MFFEKLENEYIEKLKSFFDENGFKFIEVINADPNFLFVRCERVLDLNNPAKMKNQFLRKILNIWDDEMLFSISEYECKAVDETDIDLSKQYQQLMCGLFKKPYITMFSKYNAFLNNLAASQSSCKIETPYIMPEPKAISAELEENGITNPEPYEND